MPARHALTSHVQEYHCEQGLHTPAWRNGDGPCEACGCPSLGDLPDYEALGYPETEVTERARVSADIVAANIYFLAGAWAATIGLDPMQKDIRSDTDNG